jgi:hypothetical protein
VKREANEETKREREGEERLRDERKRLRLRDEKKRERERATAPPGFFCELFFWPDLFRSRKVYGVRSFFGKSTPPKI